MRSRLLLAVTFACVAIIPIALMVVANSSSGLRVRVVMRSAAKLRT